MQVRSCAYRQCYTTSAPKKKKNVSNRLKPFPIKEISPLSVVSLSYARKRKIELEEIEAIKRRLEYLEKTVALKEEYKMELDKEEAIADTRTRLTNFFKHSMWRDLGTSGEYKISAFTVNNKGKWPYVGVLAENDGIADVYYVKGHTKKYVS